jgi:transcriptional regulator with XRE-family HTH domain
MEVEANRERQRALYGAPLVETVHRILQALGISQAVLARTVGTSPAMLSQLVGGRRVKIGDPAVLARLKMLDERAAEPVAKDRVPALLAAVQAASPAAWSPTPGEPPPRPLRPPDPTEALRAVTTPARLVAAAAALGTSFPEIAALLRQAAAGRSHPI